MFGNKYNLGRQSLIIVRNQFTWARQVRKLSGAHLCTLYSTEERAKEVLAECRRCNEDVKCIAAVRDVSSEGVEGFKISC